MPLLLHDAVAVVVVVVAPISPEFYVFFFFLSAFERPYSKQSDHSRLSGEETAHVRARTLVA